jgi:hypothetical protein
MPHINGVKIFPDKWLVAKVGFCAQNWMTGKLGIFIQICVVWETVSIQVHSSQKSAEK